MLFLTLKMSLSLSKNDSRTLVQSGLMTETELSISFFGQDNLIFSQTMSSFDL